MDIYNHDIVWLNDKMIRFQTEAKYSAGANTSSISTFSLDRLKSYMSDIRSKVDVIQGVPDLDLPESTPSIYTLRDPETMGDIENDDMAYVIRLLELGRQELIHSQSSRVGAKLKSFDARRLLAIIGKCELALAAIEADPELDLPESSPRSAMVGSGKKGV